MPAETKKTRRKATATLAAPKAKAKTKSSATTAAKTSDSAPVGPRKLKAPTRKRFRRTPKRFRAQPALPGSFRLTKDAFRLLKENWQIIGGIMAIYAVINFVLIRGFSLGLSIAQVKAQTEALLQGAGGQFATGITVFSQLVKSAGGNTPTSVSGAYETFLLLIVGMATVWTYRQLFAGNVVRVRDGFYQGMQQLVPVILVLAVVALQFIPLALGLWLYGALITDGIARNAIEIIGSLIAVLALVSVSVYMLCASLFALYIVDLPGMTPLKALRTGNELVRYRRWPLIRKLLFLPLMLLVVGAIIMLPFIVFFTIAAQFLFFAMTVVVVAILHAYMYTLYRALIAK